MVSWRFRRPPVNASYILDLTLALGRNIALLLALTFTYSLFRPSIKRLPVYPQALVDGIFFGLFALVAMLTPITVAPGVFFDGRGIMLAIAGAFSGWRAAALATANSHSHYVSVIAWWCGGNSRDWFGYH